MKLFRRGRVLQATFGCNPNSTSLGVDVTFLLFGALFASAAGVFRVALGGGEALALASLCAVAGHARARGITPNLTTSGLGLEQTSARKCAVFGQINVSVGGVGAAYEKARGFDGFRHA